MQEAFQHWEAEQDSCLGGPGQSSIKLWDLVITSLWSSVSYNIGMPITCLFTANTVMLSNFIYFIAHIQFSPIIPIVSMIVFFFFSWPRFNQGSHFAFCYCSVTKSCVTLCNPMDCSTLGRLSCPSLSPGYVSLLSFNLEQSLHLCMWLHYIDILEAFRPFVLWNVVRMKSDNNIFQTCTVEPVRHNR